MSKKWKKDAILFLVSQQISLFGSSVVSFAIVWYITLETSSGVMVMISTICAFAPQIIVSLPAGLWADKYDRKKIIIMGDSIIAGSTLILAIIFISGFKSFFILFLVSAIRSLFNGIQTPAVSAVLPQIVPKEELTRFNGISQTILSLSMLVSPAVGGAILGAFGFGVTLFVDVVTALVAVGILTFMKVRDYERDEGLSEDYWKDIKRGMSYVRNHKFLTKILIFYALFYFFITPVALMSPLLIERSFGPEIWRLTLNEIAFTVGSLLGGVFVAMKKDFKNKFLTLGVTALGFGTITFLLGLAPNFVIYIIIMGIGGIFVPIFTTAETVLLQENVEEGMLGRVFSLIAMIISAVLPFGMIIFGPLGDVIKIEYIMCATGILTLLLSPFVAGIGKLKRD